ncbi:hypothetical protein CANCADRAFT_2004 [Tortispora caseinolytica NRRL Y-17796]|uniref:Uncharacterized protein n=1 Tax=Tortispora caseinolytica NRRL Y-17796 TaxID=767744 RepID=A0A1E4TES0_9ASCO|nr:hypothetical protein CANCADRAFT_2004 [Tortispora caseinolytica NRRL Y-17796]
MTEIDEIEELAYKPPRGYKEYEKGGIKDEQIKNKEIWLVQVPECLDLEDLPKIDMKKLEKGEYRFEAKGKTFLASLELETDENMGVLIGKGAELKVSKQRVVKRLRIIEHVTLPEIDYKQVIQPQKMPEQIEGMRTRHVPMGYSLESKKRSKSDKGSKKRKKSSA